MTPAKRVAKHKQAAALAAVEHVESGMSIGLGTGSTATFAIAAIGERWRHGSLKGIVCVATSKATAELAQSYGLELLPLDAIQRLDIAIDGADEVDLKGNLIKGGGGALLVEKAVEQLAARLIIIVDETKVSPVLGKTYALPVEVAKGGWQGELDFLTRLGCAPRLRSNSEKPFLTENDNFIIDASFEGGIPDPYELAATLDPRPDVRAHGLFLDMATTVLIGCEHGVRELPLPAR